jgi:hypothetical protein
MPLCRGCVVVARDRGIVRMMGRHQAGSGVIRMVAERGQEQTRPKASQLRLEASLNILRRVQTVQCNSAYVLYELLAIPS